MLAYVHIEYSTYQFTEESKGGGRGGVIHPTRSLRYRKKRGPERVKHDLQNLFHELFKAFDMEIADVSVRTLIYLSRIAFYTIILIYKVPVFA